MKPRDIYLVGTAVITVAAAISGGLEACLWVGGIGLMVFGAVSAMFSEI